MRTALELPLRLEEERGNLRNYLFMVCVCQRAQSDGCDWLRERITSPCTEKPCKIEAPDAASRARAAPAFFPAFTAENKGRATFRAGFFA